jgi:hypothetical protein
MKLKNLFTLVRSVGLFAVIAASMVGCGKTGSKSTAVVLQQCTISNGIYYNTVGQPVAQNTCAPNTNGGNVMGANGMCYSPAGQVVATNLCTTNINSGFNNGINNQFGRTCMGLMANGWTQAPCDFLYSSFRCDFSQVRIVQDIGNSRYFSCQYSWY